MATGSGDTNARLWDLDTETPSHVLSGHRGWVLCVEWEARERKLATGGHDGHVRVWDPKTGKPIGEALRGHTAWITSLAWEPIHMWVSIGVSRRTIDGFFFFLAMRLIRESHRPQRMARFACGHQPIDGRNSPLEGTQHA